MRKQTLYGKEARAAIMEGITKITKAVKSTLGPLGRNTLVTGSVWTNDGTRSLPIYSTKDGYNTARAFDVDDYFEKAGVLLVKEAAEKTVSQAGDGTTSTCVLMEAIATAGIELVNNGANPIQLKREIDSAVAYVVDDLKKRAIQIGDDDDKILNIATISANNDHEIGRLIADAFKKIGKDGIINIEANTGVTTEVTTTEGYRFNQSYIHPLFINNKEKLTCQFENPLILLYERKITHPSQIQRVLEIVLHQRRPLLIICEDAEAQGLGSLVLNSINGGIPSCVVKAPEVGDARRQAMEDIAILTGGTYMSDSKGVGLDEIEFENLGQARKVVITREETIIIDGNCDKEALDALIVELRMNKAQAKNEDESFPIEARIARLTGSVALIKVGAPTETEMKERLDRFDDAVRATKAAISEGYVAGGGSVFFHIAKISKEDTDGHKLLMSALYAPLRQICDNAGVGYDKIAIMIGNPDLGYNAKTDTVENLIYAGVIDPAKVLRCSLQNAASSAGMVLTTECLIADIP